MKKNDKEDKKPAKYVVIGEQMAKVEDPVAVLWLEEYKKQRSKDDILKRLAALQAWRMGDFPYDEPNSMPLTPEDVSKTIEAAIRYILTH